MSDRDELAELLRTHQPTGGARVAMGATCRCGYWSETQDLERHRADVIMAAGWMNLHALEDDLDELEAADPDVKAAAKALDRASQVFGLTVSAPFCVTCTSPVCVCGVGR